MNRFVNIKACTFFFLNFTPGDALRVAHWRKSQEVELGQLRCNKPCARWSLPQRRRGACFEGRARLVLVGLLALRALELILCAPLVAELEWDYHFRQIVGAARLHLGLCKRPNAIEV